MDKVLEGDSIEDVQAIVFSLSTIDISSPKLLFLLKYCELLRLLQEKQISEALALTLMLLQNSIAPKR